MVSIRAPRPAPWSWLKSKRRTLVRLGWNRRRLVDVKATMLKRSTRTRALVVAGVSLFVAGVLLAGFVAGRGRYCAQTSICLRTAHDRCAPGPCDVLHQRQRR